MRVTIEFSALYPHQVHKILDSVNIELKEVLINITEELSDLPINDKRIEWVGSNYYGSYNVKIQLT